MKTVSNAFTAKMSDTLRTWIPRMTINGVEIEGDIQAGLTINTGSCGTEQFSVGAMFVPYITASIKDCGTIIQDQELFLEMGLKLDDESVEYLPVGYFTASKVDKDKFIASIEAYGRLMSKGGGLYISDLVWPATIENVINEISEKMGVPIITKNVDISGTIDVQMVGLLYREALQYIAGLIGGFCTEDSNGNIILTKYELRESVSVDTDFCYAFPTKSDAEYEVTGIEVIVSGDSTDEEGNTTEGQKYSYGYFVNVTVSNPYMTESLFEECKSNAVGLKYLPATVNFLGDIRLEPWDYLIVTDDDEVLNVPCMNITHTWDGGLVTVVTAPGASQTETEESFGGPLTVKVERTYQELMTAKQIIASKISANEADIKYATIASLTATDAKIVSLSGELANFKSGEFQTLKSAQAKFEAATTEKLEAVEANIKTLTAETLKTNELEAEVAKLGYATVTELNATKATIKDLSGEFVSFKTGEFNDLKSNVAEIENAYMDHAEVETLVVSKGYITALSVNTLLADYVKTTTLEANYITAESIAAEYATITNFDALKGSVDELQAKAITTDNLEAKVGEFGYLKAKELEANVGEFGYLKADVAATTYATITSLNSANATIENLNGEFASYKTTVTQEFSARDAEISTLKVRDAEIDEVLINKASVSELNTVKGNISELTSNVARIDTLVNGNLTADNIQSLVISGSKFTVADGFITNAMIETLEFDKITGVDINTKNVTIHSDDGKSTWSDNTIQISDASRVRVQMGKDASGDYTLAVWDSTGKLIWDALGATENTIQRAIIKDAVVAADANIAGSKLDIESVITEVNGAETAILGTKIRLDEQDQTLQAAFTSLKSYAEGTRSITTSQQTSINTMQGQISTLISNTTITKDGQTVQLKDAYNTTVSDINSIKTTLGEHKSTIDSHTGSIQSVTTKANTIESDLSSTKQTISSVQSTLTSTQSRVSTVENDITGLKSRVSANETAISGKADGSVVTTLSGKVATFESTLDGFETALEKNYSKVTSKGEQLIVNGNGMLGDNTNFKNWVFDGAVGNNSPGSFTRAVGSSGTLFSDEYFLVSTNKTYTFSFDAKSLLGTGTMYSFIMFYDVDKNQIGAPQHMYHPGSTTTLAQDLKAGDEVIHLTDASGWSTSVSYGFYLAVWNYRNSFGYTYPAETYTRNRITLPKTSSNKLDSSCIDFTANTITLTSAYSGDTIPAGTPVSQGRDGGTYKYTPITGVEIPTEWTTYIGKVGGVDYSGTNKGGMFPPGVAYAKIGFLWNYNKASGEQQWITNIAVTDTTDVNELEEVVSNHETRIAAAEGQILLKVSTSDFNSYKNTVTSDIATAKSGAISAAASDATTKANKALSDAKAYTTAEITTVNESINSTNQEISVMKGQIALKVEQSNIDAAITSVRTDFAETLKSYSTTSEMNTAITAETGKISSKVSTLETSVNTVSTTVNDNKESWDKAVTDSAKALTDSASALLKHDVEVLASNVKSFKNVCALTANGNSTGYLVITTPILPNRMVSISLKGYIYSGTNETVDLVIGFYNYGSSMLNTGYVSKGSFDVSEVKVGKISASDTRAVVIIGTASTKWIYPKLVVEEVIVGHTDPPDSYKDGFSMEIVSTLPDTYTHLTNVSGSDFKSEISSTKETVAEHTVSLTDITGRVSTTETNITTINGNLSSIESRISSAEQKITADAITSAVRSHSSYQNDLDGKVSTSNVISCINQSAETVTILASKINLSGVVTISSFDSKLAQAMASMPKKINTHLRSFTAAYWQSYGTEGHSESWTTGSSYDNTHINVGDVAYIVGTVSDAKGNNTVTAIIYGRVTSVTTSSVVMTSMYYTMGGEAGAYALATSAKNQAASVNTVITNWCHENDTTYIDGGKIYASSLSSISANLGTVTAGVLQSENFAMSDYNATAGGNVTGTVTSGLKIDLNNTAYYTPQIVIKDNYIDLRGYMTVGQRIDEFGNTDHEVGAFSLSVGACYASGDNSFCSGADSYATGHASFATGSGKATALCAHAEGLYTTASATGAHAEGYATTANGANGHAEGGASDANGYCSHAEGYQATANGDQSHAEGYYTRANSENQHVQGKYNVVDNDGVYAHIVGNGTSDSARSNAHTLDWSGNAWYAGDVIAGGTQATDGTVTGGVSLKKSAPRYIVGTGTTAGTWLGTDDSITEYFDGLTVLYKVGIAGASTTTLNINGLGAVQVMRNASSAVTTHYGVNSIVLLTYTTDDGTGYWKIADYDANSYAYVRQYYTTANGNYPLLSKYDAGITTTTNYVTKYSRYSNKFYINPSTGVLTAPTFSGALDGNATSATKATQDGDGNTISSTYLKLSGGTMTGILNLTANKAQINFRPDHASYDGIISYETSGNEAMVFSTKNAVTSFMFVNGEDMVTNVSGSRWQSLTPGLQIKNNCVAIGKLIANGTTPTHKLDVAGTIYASSTIYEGGTALSSKYAPLSHTHAYLSSSPTNIELNSTGSLQNYGGFIDFHWYENNTDDYTSRIIENAKGQLAINGVTITTGKVVTATTFVGALSGNATSATSATNDKNGKDITRIYCSMIPAGTAIPANADLNTKTYIKVGNYYCSSNNTVKTLTNCPLTGTDSSGNATGIAFMMQVYSPLATTLDDEDTGTYRYRIRKIIQYNTGEEYIQYVSSGATAGTFSYGSWRKVLHQPYYGTAIGSTSKPVYISSTGVVTAGSTYAGGTAVTLNGSSKAASTASFYAPTEAGTSEYVLKSAGSGAPSWVAQSTLSVGSATKANNLYNGDGVGYVNITLSSNAYYFKPGATSFTTYCGGANYRWNTVYAVNALNTSSDLRFKTNISKDFDKYVNMMDNIEPITFIRTNSDENKRHAGYGAQDVEKALQIVGLTNNDFAGLSKDWDEEKQGYTYGLTYEEFIPILHARQNRDRREFVGRLRTMESELRYVHQKLNAALDKIAEQEKEIEQLKLAS